MTALPGRRLSSGGVIANYRCPAACGHCLYGCSPTAEPGYITEETARRVCGQLRTLGCRSLHIGGGEPFLHVDGLIALIRVIRESGIHIDYIETNAAWITGDTPRDRETLRRVADAGGECIMVSADPFHIAFVPFGKPRALVGLLQEMGVPFFIWQERYWPMLSKLDPTRIYDSAALCDVLGDDVISRCAREYGMGFNGRALNLLRSIACKQPAEAWLQETPCAELFHNGHYHVDYLGRYIPPGCTGIGVQMEDINKPLSDEQYPVVARLSEGGTARLFTYAQSRGYMQKPDGYASGCDLCFHMRQFLSLNEPEKHPDLSPAMFYRQDY